jgi:hypothetical protein
MSGDSKTEKTPEVRREDRETGSREAAWFNEMQTMLAKTRKKQYPTPKYNRIPNGTLVLAERDVCFCSGACFLSADMSGSCARLVRSRLTPKRKPND